ncbi:hypothetical protein BJF87_07415 [Gordonia sp. CNJ-863]|nr:hypothetical protein BJF87_07415 [Gordonia sp. CNJ-863]
MSASATAAVIYLGVGPTAIAFSTWAYALARTDAGAMAATTLVVPAIVIVMSWALLDELPTGVGIVGGVLCIGGVAVARRLLPLTRRVVSVPPEDAADDAGATVVPGPGVR